MRIDGVVEYGKFPFPLPEGRPDILLFKIQYFMNFECM